MDSAWNHVQLTSPNDTTHVHLSDYIRVKSFMTWKHKTDCDQNEEFRIVKPPAENGHYNYTDKRTQSR